VQSHKNTLIQEDTAIAELVAWKSFVLNALWLMLLGYIGISGWIAFENKVWLQPVIVWAPWAIEHLAVALGLCVLIGLTNTAIKILNRLRLEQNLRFDVFAAVCEVTSQALARHIPDYHRLTTVIAVGEDLLKPVKTITDRAAQLQLALQQQMPGLGLAQAIDQIVKNALQAEGISATVTNVETILSQIERSPDGIVVAFGRS
jgi:hypothetical protein